jgi:hypothetical protein
MRAQEQEFTILSQNLHQSEQKLEGKFHQFANKLDSIWGSIADIDEKVSQTRHTPKGKQPAGDVISEMSQALTLLKTRVKDLEKLSKDLKLQQVKQEEKLIVTAGELTKSLEVAREEVKLELTEHVIGPESAYLRGQLGELSEYSKSFSEGVNKSLDDFAVSTDQLKRSIAVTTTELQRAKDVQEDCLGDITGLKASNQRLDVGFEQLKRNCRDDLNKLSSELKTAQTNGQRSSEAQISELRHKVENAAKLSDEYYLAKMQEFSDNAIFPVISMQRGELEELATGIDTKLRQEMFVLGKNLQSSFKKSIIEGLEHKMMSMEAKLKWLPLDLKEITNMQPYEARLFTLEARLRTEEDRRHVAQERISSDIEFLRRFATPLTSVRPDTGQGRTPSAQPIADTLPRSFTKKPSVVNPGGMVTPDMWRNLSQRRQTSSQLAVRSKRSNLYAVNLVNPYDFGDSKESQAEAQTFFEELNPRRSHSIKVSSSKIDRRRVVSTEDTLLERVELSSFQL